MNNNNSVRKVVILALSSALVFVGKFALYYLPNIEMVTFLLIIFTLTYRLKEALLISTVYTLVEILLWGISEQFYIWTLIVLLTFLFKNIFKSNFVLWSLFSGFLGLSFGLLSSIPFLIISGYQFALSYFIVGLKFDVLHMVGNYVFMIVLGELSYKQIQILLRDYYSTGGNNEDLY